MRVTLWHNPRCSKSRQALALLREHGVEPVIFEYLEEQPGATQIRRVLQQLGIGPRALLRSGEQVYKSLGLADAALPDAKLIAAMAAHPILIERPIAVSGRRAVIGRPPERVLDLL